MGVGPAAAVTRVMTGSPVSSLRRPATAGASATRPSPRGSLQPHQPHQPRSFCPPSITPSSLVSGGGGAHSTAPNIPRSPHHRPHTAAGHSGDAAYAGMSPGLAMLAHSVRRMERPRPCTASASSPRTASGSSPRAAPPAGAAAASPAATPRGAGHGGTGGKISHSPYALANFPEPPPEMAARITAREAEKMVTVLKADYNLVAGKALKMAAMLFRMEEESKVGRRSLTRWNPR